MRKSKLNNYEIELKKRKIQEQKLRKAARLVKERAQEVITQQTSTSKTFEEMEAYAQK